MNKWRNIFLIIWCVEWNTIDGVLCGRQCVSLVPEAWQDQWRIGPDTFPPFSPFHPSSLLSTFRIWANGAWNQTENDHQQHDLDSVASLLHWKGIPIASTSTYIAMHLSHVISQHTHRREHIKYLISIFISNPTKTNIKSIKKGRKKGRKKRIKKGMKKGIKKGMKKKGKDSNDN